MKSYDYAHRQGVKEISWDEFAAMSAQLAEGLDKMGAEVIVGIARAGLFPAAAVACSLRRELVPVRVMRRVNRGESHSWSKRCSPAARHVATASAYSWAVMRRSSGGCSDAL